MSAGSHAAAAARARRERGPVAVHRHPLHEERDHEQRQVGDLGGLDHVERGAREPEEARLGLALHGDLVEEVGDHRSRAERGRSRCGARRGS